MLASVKDTPAATPGLLLAGRRVGFAVLLVLLAAAFATTFVADVRGGLLGFDFRGTVWEPARAIVNGASPYPRPDAAALLAAGNPSIYPPVLLVAAVPLAQLPLGGALAAWTLLQVACIAAALWLVGLRDWRCYALCLVSFPLLGQVVMGQVEGLMLLGAAIAWRFREHARVPIAAVALLVAAKLYLWPLLIWLALQRRIRDALLRPSRQPSP